MRPIVVLDSAPLGLLFQKSNIKPADECREWMRRLLASGTSVVVPEIVYYELRRELLRLNLTAAVNALAGFTHSIPGRYIPMTTASLELAAELWAKARNQGKPTAHPHALDIDVILAAQILTQQYAPIEFVVATSNVSHVGLFVPAEPWEMI